MGQIDGIFLDYVGNKVATTFKSALLLDFCDSF